MKTTDLFAAKAEDGQVHWIQELTEFGNTSTSERHSNDWTEVGLKMYQTRDGESFNAVGPDEFTLVSTGARLTRIK